MQAPTRLDDVLMFHIFPKVHPITILRCRSLNRYFYRYLSSTEFIRENTFHSRRTSSHRLLIISTPDHDLYSIDTESPDTHARLIPLPPLPPIHSPDSHFDLVGTCLGILCLRRPHHSHSLNMIDFQFMFFNPATGASCLMLPWASIYGVWLPRETKVTRFGFGFDSSNVEFKFVLVEYYLQYRDVYVYRLSRASWIHANHTRLPLHSSRSSPWYWRNVSVNGVLVKLNLLHWLDFYCHDNATLFEISCFDVKTEQWQNNVPLPKLDNNNNNSTRAVNLWALDDLLCLTTMNGGSGGSLNIDVWVMKTYGDQESWVKLFIASPSCNYIPLFGHELRELLLSAYYPPTFGAPIYAWYSLRDQSTRRVEYDGPLRQYNVLSLTIASLLFPIFPRLHIRLY